MCKDVVRSLSLLYYTSVVFIESKCMSARSITTFFNENHLEKKKTNGDIIVLHFKQNSFFFVFKQLKSTNIVERIEGYSIWYKKKEFRVNSLVLLNVDIHAHIIHAKKTNSTNSIESCWAIREYVQWWFFVRHQSRLIDLNLQYNNRNLVNHRHLANVLLIVR